MTWVLQVNKCKSWDPNSKPMLFLFSRFSVQCLFIPFSNLTISKNLFQINQLQIQSPCPRPQERGQFWILTAGTWKTTPTNIINNLLCCQAALVVKNPPVNAGDIKRLRFNPWVRQPTPEFLPGESHGQRSLEGYSPWAPKESDMTERTRSNCSLSMVTVSRLPILSFWFINAYQHCG